MSINLNIDIDPNNMSEQDKAALNKTAGYLLSLTGAVSGAPKPQSGGSVFGEELRPARGAVGPTETDSDPRESDQADEKPKARKTRAKKAGRSISDSPENRQAEDEIDEANAEQDAADEAAEEAGESTPAPEPAAPVEYDEKTLVAAMQDYADKFTLAVFREDGVKLFNDVLGTPPGGAPHWTRALILTAGADAVEKAVKALRQSVDSGKRWGTQ